ncbi:MAG: ThiF family adenylyltransferase [Thermogemmata sp.]|uniref:ThiF family adenylyltransferase n=1 Tax=Thermogemmata fonticola TaxID=2755323 RepID=A0A7V8VG41_9BACT|nr:ThiF family adenylyltransferase [Thermogemmata fonticola]MBA2227398.1 ThiF family adenylyltransferase [Thermogemmata fonticola]MCX8140700.1 ThiF family adenylyltransferase [Gemmataceae bacterium]
MARLFQAGVGSGGMVVLDLLCRDSQIEQIVLVEPDVYAPHNVVRHLFPPSAIGRRKVEVAAEWVRERRPDLAVQTFACNLHDAAWQGELAAAAQACDVGICAVDNEPAKYAFDALMRRAGRPWTLGEVLSGGIGGWVHCFVPEGPCYGCVASYLQREVVEAPPSPPPDYSQPQAAQAELTIPASAAAIHAIASLHALVTRELLQAVWGKDEEKKKEEAKESGGAKDGEGTKESPLGFTSLLWSLQRVEGIFDEPFRSYRFRIARSPTCLLCSVRDRGVGPGEALDVALDQALARLAPP